MSLMQMTSAPHVLKLQREVDEILLVVDRADRIGHRGLGDAAVLLDALHSLLKISGVVERVEDPDDVDAVFDRLLDEAVQNVIRIVFITQDILAAQQHLQLRIGKRLSQRAKPLPRVLVEEPHARVERRTAPHFQRPVADTVEYRAGRQHVFRAHACSGLRLMRVPQYRIGY
jgi:hypothetical protein